MNKIYTVYVVDFPDTFRDSCEVHWASSRKKCIEFIKRALTDKNSGIQDDTVIFIAKVTLDGYFSQIETEEEKRAIEYVE